MTAKHNDQIRAKVEKKCLSALARREHSRHELAEKCAEFPSEIVTEVLEELSTRGWQDDARFVESYVRSYGARGQGEIKIRQKLKQKGIAASLIYAALNQVNWEALATEAYQRKYTTPAKTPAERAKRQRFLAGRGFTFEQIKVAEKAFSDNWEK